MNPPNGSLLSPSGSDCTVLPSISCDPKIYGTQIIDSNKTSLQRPNCIGEFSLDQQRRLQLGRSRVRYLYETALNKKVSTSLTQGFNEFITKDCDEGLDQILGWIVSMATPNSSLKKTIHECNFVVWRGTLTRLLASPYDIGSYSVGIKIACTKYKDVYFIREYDTQEKIQSESTRSDYQRRMCYGGFKFEQIITIDDIDQKPDTSAPVNQNNEFVGMFKATLDGTQVRPTRKDGILANPSTTLLYGAEIDCISAQGNYLEIKTQYKNIGYGKGFTSKALKWWIQSYLIGIKQLVIGLHENFILKRVELFPVESLTKFFIDAGCSSAICFAFLQSFLQTVRRYLDEAEEGAILIAERMPTSSEFKFHLFRAESKPAEEYRVISNFFKVHGWK